MLDLYLRLFFATEAGCHRKEINHWDLATAFKIPGHGTGTRNGFPCNMMSQCVCLEQPPKAGVAWMSFSKNNMMSMSHSRGPSEKKGMGLLGFPFVKTTQKGLGKKNGLCKLFPPWRDLLGESS